MVPHDSLPGIVIAEYLGIDSRDHAKANRFLETYTIGNDTEVVDRPFERFKHYEELMHGLRSLDVRKYEEMHKGTPFFFMAWLSFDMRNFERALFYLDTAISGSRTGQALRDRCIFCGNLSAPPTPKTQSQELFILNSIAYRT